MIYNKVLYSSIMKSFHEHNFVSKAARVSQGKSWEGFVKRHLEKCNINVLRTDYKNKQPDFLAIKHEDNAVFVECKCYTSCSNPRIFYNEWAKNQPEQRKRFLKLAKIINIVFIVNLSDRPFIQNLIDLENEYGQDIR